MPLNPKEEQEFKDLHDKCHALKVMPPPAIFIGLKVEKDGEVIIEDKQRGHSWTRNFYNAALSGMTGVAATGATFGAGHISGRDTGGTVRGVANYGAGCCGGSLPWSYDGYIYKVAASSTGNGIVVGTNDGAFSAEAYELNALIAHGTGAGQMSYGAQDLPSTNYDSTAGSEKWTVTHTRIFNNNSGGSIVVAEVGLIWGTINNSRAARWVNINNNYLDERSVLSPTVTVPNGAQLTVTYDIEMDFSAIDGA